MRVDWQQSLEGRSLLEIRNLFRALYSSEAAFSAEFIARRLTGDVVPGRTALRHARDLARHLIASGLIKVDEDTLHPSRDRFVLTDAGMSLRAATAIKRFKRARAERAVDKLLSVVADINSDPIFLHDVAWVAVYGSYLGDDPDLGDIDVAIQLRARWKPGRGDNTDRIRRKKRFEAKCPPPESFYEKHWWRFWPETYTNRLLRTDPAMQIIERSDLEELGCSYREIFPSTKDVPAKSDWSCERQEIILRLDDGTAESIIEEAFRRARANATERRKRGRAEVARLRKQAAI